MIWAAIVWFSLAGLYLLFAGNFSFVEAFAGMASATTGTLMAVGLSRVTVRRFAGWPTPRSIGRPILALVPEAFAVGLQFVAAIFIAREQRGCYVRQGFVPGHDDPASAGRRAAVVLGLSLAPGSIVIRGDRTDALMLHALPQKSASPDWVWPA